MKKTIDIQVADKQFSIPNQWELLTSGAFIELVKDIELMKKGYLSIGDVRLRFVQQELGLADTALKDDAMANLISISEKVTFPFIIEYPNDNEVLEFIPKVLRIDARRIDPSRLPSAYAKILQKQNYHYTVDMCFCAQLCPDIVLGKEVFHPYRITTDYETLTTSLTTLQFIEARDVMSHTQKMPLLAAILYCPGEYSTEKAVALAKKFDKIDRNLLVAISLNFASFVNYLFTRTPYSLLSQVKAEKQPLITTGPLENLYGLCADGYGNIFEVEKMNLLQYLTILRKKLIDGVRSMHQAQQDSASIETATGLPLNIIKNIIS